MRIEMNIVDNDMSKVNKIMAGAGIAGTIIYAIADMFLYIGQDVLSDEQMALWDVPEWRLMTSMWIGVIGSLLLLMGFISLGKMYHNVFNRWGNVLILPSLLCIGGVLYMHFTLGVYSPLTYRSAINAGVSESQIVTLIEHAQSYLNPLTYTLAILGYLTEIILIYGILSGKFGLKKRNVFYIFGGYFILVLIFVVFAKITGEWGVTGSLESLLEMTFFIPAYLYWRKK
ncbi:MAG: hypothetical protein IJ224_06935 [Lachnospiraceae bacterium]|nr:hypothetical protein [Lachnospiraceae bacterium]